MAGTRRCHRTCLFKLQSLKDLLSKLKITRYSSGVDITRFLSLVGKIDYTTIKNIAFSNSLKGNHEIFGKERTPWASFAILDMHLVICFIKLIASA